MYKNKSIGAVVVFYKTSHKNKKSIVAQLNKIVDKNILVCIDNTKNNLGFAHGVNKGIQKLLKQKTDIIIVANPDIHLFNITRTKLFEAANRFAIFGFPFRENTNIFYAGVIDPWNMSGGFTQKQERKKYIKTDFVSGSFMCIQRSVINKIGNFDTRYFMYYEDVEYCLRARKNGFSIGIRTDNIYEHAGGVVKNKEYYLIRNRLLTLFRYGTIIQKLHEIAALPKHCTTNMNNIALKLRAVTDFLYIYLFNKHVQY